MAARLLMIPPNLQATRSIRQGENMETSKEERVRTELDQVLGNLSAITSESLIRTNELGTSLDFRNGVPVFERTLRLFRDLKEANLDNIPLNILAQLKQSAEEAIVAFQQIQQFNPAGQNNPAQVRDQLISKIEDQYHNHFARITPIIAYSVRKGTDFELLERNARTTLDELQRIRTDIERSGKTLVAEAQASLEQVRRAAAEVGVAQHAVHFKEEAGRHKQNSTIWLIATGIMAAVALGYGVWNVWYYMTYVVEYTIGQAVQVAIAKLVIFGVLSYAVVWCGRTYRAQMHNYVINQHRQNALSTFETFVKAASDVHVKDAVLMQATQSIFSPQHSGFMEREITSDGSPKMVEIVRNAAATARYAEKT
jgi:hypothetical protein